MAHSSRTSGACPLATYATGKGHGLPLAFDRVSQSRLWAISLCVPPEPEVERHEDQDNANVGSQPLPHMASEEQDVDPDHDTDHRDQEENGSCRPSHAATLPRGAVNVALRQRCCNDP